jgi:hypothetical protein
MTGNLTLRKCLGSKTSFPMIERAWQGSGCDPFELIDAISQLAGAAWSLIVVLATCREPLCPCSKEPSNLRCYAADRRSAALRYTKSIRNYPLNCAMRHNPKCPKYSRLRGVTQKPRT